MQMAKIIRFFKAYKRIIVFLLVFGYAAFLLIHPDEFGRALDLIFFALWVMFIASQFFWIRRVLDLGKRFLPGKRRRTFLAVVAGLIYLFIFTCSYPSIESTNAHILRAADYRLHSVLIEAAYWWWFVGSQMAFVLVVVFWAGGRGVRAGAWLYRKARQTVARHPAALQAGALVLDPPLPARRRFLQQSFVAVSATPFLAAGYGLLCERIDVEVTHPRIKLARLPKAFEGFRIAQLSDFHIAPFTTADYIRRCVTITNGLNPDLVVMTGDYVAWDPEAQSQVVQVLAGLRAPHGVFGCLGNHEQEGEIEESITRLFAVQGIRILRQERAAIRLRGATLNLIGIDDPRGRSRAEWEHDVYRRLQRVKGLVLPGTVNILLIHDPAVFQYATELSIDLVLAGHTHGGQLSLDFIHRGLNLGRLLAHYVSGSYEKDGRWLYVNRGIGTTGFPIRLGARPEITVLELTQGA